MTAAPIVNAARQLVGTRFRLHGRDAETGVDCVGLIVAALKLVGASTVNPKGYGLRQMSVEHLMPFAGRNGFRPVSGNANPGDLILFALPAAQHHLAISVGGNRIVHAHAGLRRVVEGTPVCDWRIDQVWRHSTQTKE